MDEPINAQEIYASLWEEFSSADVKVWYAQNTKDKHLFMIGGLLHLYDSPFEHLHQFSNTFQPDETHITNTASGGLIRFIFTDDRISNAPPSPEASYDTVTHRGVDENRVYECSNCREAVDGLPIPPVKLMYPSEDSFENPEIEKHYLCVICSPGHYDDVARVVDYFAIEDNTISRIGFEKTEDKYNGDTYIDWTQREELENPFIQTTVETLEKYLV